MKYTSSEKLGNLVNNALQEAGEYGQDLFQEVFKNNEDPRIVVMYTECEEDQIGVHDRMDELVDNVIALVDHCQQLFENIFIGSLDSNIGALAGCTCNVYVAAETEEKAAEYLKERLMEAIKAITGKYDLVWHGVKDSAADDE